MHDPRRYHQYKFIVDGEWRHDEMQPFMPDPLGNVNNWLFVRKPELHPQQQRPPVQQPQPATAGYDILATFIFPLTSYLMRKTTMLRLIIIGMTPKRATPG